MIESYKNCSTLEKEDMNNAILSEGNIYIDKSLIKIGESTFSVSSIGSISIKKEKTGLFNFLAFMVAAISLALIASSAYAAIAFFVVSCFIIGKLGLDKYIIIVKNSSGDQPLLTVKKKDQADRIKQAVEEALRLRS
ncbi:DUF6232 family protein [Komagataeibacter xylinus]|uniref:DUF6232 family protein n=1 Tax=Komagataeibacter xylinus TaxID=28448 RepID=UPI00280B4A48|nr:DUF6232 family protein [Komagataeibacter xylinus]